MVGGAAFDLRVNRQHKDTVFRDLFGSEARKGNALSLYNSLRGTNHTNIDDLEITTISGAIYMGFKNDASILIDDELSLWEHQSTYNPNMPLRGLFYFSELYSHYMSRQNFNRFSTRRIALPTPRYYVFYTGLEPRPEREELRLSDSFAGTDPALEVKAVMLDVREGSNSAIMETCQTLAGYAHFVGLVRENMENASPEEAIDRAVTQCIADGHLVDYLTERRAEVVSLMLTEWDEEETLRQLRQEAVEDGFAEGMAAGRAEGMAAGREKGLAEGRAAGRAEGMAAGRAEGMAAGRAEGEAAGKAEARQEYVQVAARMVADGILDLKSAIERFALTEQEAASLV